MNLSLDFITFRNSDITHIVAKAGDTCTLAILPGTSRSHPYTDLSLNIFRPPMTDNDLPPLSARAAMHATAEEVAEMESILGRQQQKMSQGELAIEEDAEFHYAIALAADNSVVLKVIDVLMDLLRDTRERSLQLAGRPERSIAGHREILEAIKRRDEAGAEAAMCRHIEAVENIVFTKL